MQYVEGHTLADVIQELRHFSGLEAKKSGNGNGSVSQLAKDLTSGRFASIKTVNGNNSSLVKNDSGKTATSALGGVISEGSTKSPAFFRSVARLGIQAAEALDHAHTHGIVHRDIKPSNLLLDLEGTVWITDFGLAQCHTDTGMTLTMPGDLLGTIRYMSPEQALGKRTPLDHRTDV